MIAPLRRMGTAGTRSTIISRHSDGVVGAIGLATLLASLPLHGAPKAPIPGPTPLSAQERVQVDAARQELRATLATFDALKNGLSLHPEVTRALQAKRGKQLRIAGQKDGALVLQADGKLAAVLEDRRTPATWRDLSVYDIFSGAAFHDLVHARIDEMLRQRAATRSAAIAGTAATVPATFFDWSGHPPVAAQAVPPKTPELTSFTLDKLAPPTLFARLAAKVHSGGARSEAGDTWDLQRMKEGGFWLWNDRIQLASRYRWRTGLHASLVLQFEKEKPTLKYEENRKSTPATRAQVASFGIKTQADLDARILVGLRLKAHNQYLTDKTKIGSSHDSSLGSPTVYMPEEFERAVAAIATKPEERTRQREQLMSRIDEERFLKQLGDGHFFQEDIQLLGKLRELAPPNQVVDGQRFASTWAYDQRRHLVLATDGRRSLVVSRLHPTSSISLNISEGRAPWQESHLNVYSVVESPLRAMGITTHADMEAVIGRAFLKYAPESFLAD